MKIERVDEFTRLVTFPDGIQVRVLRGWKRNGGWGWTSSDPWVVQTYPTIREAATRLHQDAVRRTDQAGFAAAYEALRS